MKNTLLALTVAGLMGALSMQAVAASASVGGDRRGGCNGCQAAAAG